MPPETNPTKLLGFNGSEAHVTEDGLYRVRVFMHPLLAAMLDALDEVGQSEEDSDAAGG